MIKYLCDICGKDIDGNFYRINIIEESTTKFLYGEIVSELYGSASSSASSNMSAKTTALPMYCEKCMDKIASYIRSGLGNSDFRW